jgi:hypothetical protein
MRRRIGVLDDELSISKIAKLLLSQDAGSYHAAILTYLNRFATHGANSLFFSGFRGMTE